jgi:hypothetical protein
MCIPTRRIYVTNDMTGVRRKYLECIDPARSSHDEAAQSQAVVDFASYAAGLVTMTAIKPGTL